eukprot:1854237-Amphidinium_carterae.1
MLATEIEKRCNAVPVKQQQKAATVCCLYHASKHCSVYDPQVIEHERNAVQNSARTQTSEMPQKERAQIDKYSEMQHVKM